MEVSYPFSLLRPRPAGTQVDVRSKTIEHVRRVEQEASCWDYFLSGVKVARCVSVDLPLALFSLLLPARVGSKLVFRVLAGNGAVAMKLGQFLSTRPDLLSPYLLKRLATLQMNAPYAGVPNVQEVFLQETGVLLPKENIHERIGAGCISQVYRVSLGGRDCAVKIINPQTRVQIFADLFVLHKLSKMFGAERFFSEFQGMMQKQVDLRNEKNNTDTFRRNFWMFQSTLESNTRGNRVLEALRGHRYSYIFPRPVVATKNMLVTEYWAGSKVGPSSAEALVHLFLKMTFQDRFIHSDLHPGNLAVVQAEQRTALVVYDAGLAHVLQKQQRENLVDLMKNVLLNRPEATLSLIVDRNKKNKHLKEEKQLFIRESSALWRKTQKKQAQTPALGLEVYLLAKRHRVFLDECYTNAVMSSLYVQQVALKSHPGFHWARLFCLAGLGREYVSLLCKWAWSG
ncbi:hypothetical protein NEDG_00994 [Nematocida displodere]|uniref:Protein kinase domain-containing protein n=1 Tax=Nematocida displodere TaxID=1805483 RepID=A0A177EAB5_9MICR|nr:hypothetical protein NEDG_00994 [Nematocida displodere]